MIDDFGNIVIDDFNDYDGHLQILHIILIWEDGKNAPYCTIRKLYIINSKNCKKNNICNSIYPN